MCHLSGCSHFMKTKTFTQEGNIYIRSCKTKKLTLSTETISGHYIVGSLQDLCSVVHLVINNGYCGKAL